MIKTCQRYLTILAISCILITSLAQADTEVWNGADKEGSFLDGQLWTSNFAPTASDDAIIDADNTIVDVIESSVNVSTLVLGPSKTNITLVLNNTLTASNVTVNAGTSLSSNLKEVMNFNVVELLNIGLIQSNGVLNSNTSLTNQGVFVQSGATSMHTLINTAMYSSTAPLTVTNLQHLSPAILDINGQLTINGDATFPMILNSSADFNGSNVECNSDTLVGDHADIIMSFSSLSIKPKNTQDTRQFKIGGRFEVDSTTITLDKTTFMQLGSSKSRLTSSRLSCNAPLTVSDTSMLRGLNSTLSLSSVSLTGSSSVSFADSKVSLDNTWTQTDSTSVSMANSDWNGVQLTLSDSTFISLKDTQVSFTSTSLNGEVAMTSVNSNITSSKILGNNESFVSLIQSNLIATTFELVDQAHLSNLFSNLNIAGLMTIKGSSIYSSIASTLTLDGTFVSTDSATVSFDTDSSVNNNGQFTLGSSTPASIGSFINSGQLNIDNQYVDFATLDSTKGTILFTVSTPNSTYAKITYKAILDTSKLIIRIGSNLTNVNITLITLPDDSKASQNVEFKTYDAYSDADVSDVSSCKYRAQQVGNDLVIFVGTNSDQCSPSSSSSKLSKGAIAGIVIGCVVFLALLITLAVVLVKKRSRSASRDNIGSATKLQKL